MLDCGLFDALDADERRVHVAGLAAVTEPEAIVVVLCFGDEGTGTGPHPVGRAELHAAFPAAAGWDVLAVEPERLATRFSGADGAPAWLATVRRVPPSAVPGA